ncbi:hypothetical protein [Sphingobacterium anhuiense]|uniref:hypothetical protein n=1 Tax=Sphingobacterium anhuiense TaxID=493780 RepID=UPI003C2B1879
MSEKMVVSGQRFEMKSMRFPAVYYFSIDRSNQLQIMRKGGAHQCYVDEVTEEGIHVYSWIMNKKAVAFLPYNEMTYIENLKK